MFLKNCRILHFSAECAAARNLRAPLCVPQKETRLDRGCSFRKGEA